MQKVFSTAFLIGIACCASGGSFVAGRVTDAGLDQNNFTAMARNVTGEAEAGYVLGVVRAHGRDDQHVCPFSHIRFGSTVQRGAGATVKKVETACGPIETRKLALINVRYDAEAPNLLLHTQPRITIRADVVECSD